MWYQIITSLQTFLGAKEVADEIVLGYPDARPVPGKTLVYICRLDEECPFIYHGGEGTVNIEVGCYTTSISQDMADGYLILENLEQNVRKAVVEWACQSQPTQTPEIMQVSVVKSGGQPFEERPVIGSFIELKIDWSARTL